MSTPLMIFVSFETIRKEPSFFLEPENGVLFPSTLILLFPVYRKMDSLWECVCCRAMTIGKKQDFFFVSVIFFFSRSFVFFMITFKIRASKNGNIFVYYYVT